MRCVLWLLLLLFYSDRTAAELDPGEQAKVSTALDTTQFVLDQLAGDIKGEQKALKEAMAASKSLKSAELLKKQTKLLKVGKMVGRALKAIQAASAIASFIFTFFMPSDLDVITSLINKRFNEVNAKLDRLDQKLDEMEASIKANSAFNTFLSAWIKWEYKSKNGAKKLSDIRKAMGTKTRRIDQVKLAEEYVKYYENNNLDGNLLNLYRMAALSEGITQRNLFDRFIAEYGCDITQLTELMMLIKGIMTSAAQQKLTYYYLKGDQGRATQGFNDVQKYFFQIRRAFDDRVWNCRRESVNHAKKDAQKILTKSKGSSQESNVKAIFDELKVKYPWYTWGVAAIKDYRTNITKLEWKGSRYFKVEDRSDLGNVKEYYIVYEDTKSLASCSEIRQAKTLLVFKGCDGCNSDYIYAADNILSHKKCGLSNLQKLVDFQTECKSSRYRYSYWTEKECIKDLKNQIKKMGFLATNVNTNYNPCTTSEKCSGHGQCKQIPFTKTHQCICVSHYGGESCEKRIEFDDTTERLMAQLRKTFNVVNGVPTVVDIFFSIRSLSQKLDLVLQKIKASFAHTNNIIQHSRIIYNVEDIADLYAKLQKDKLSFDQFGQKMDLYLKTITAFQLQNRLKKMILGQGTLDKPGKDIYNSYKLDYLSHNGGGCSGSYNADIKGFRDDLAYLDQALGEALLLHKKWLLETKGTTDALRSQYKREAQEIENVFKGRQKAYNQYWNKYSCGTLGVEGTTISCKHQLSFEGMTMTVSCDKQRQPTPGTVKCRKINGVLKWDSQPKCKFVWGNWRHDWTRCSTNCGGGFKTNYRPCLGTNNVDDCKRDQGGLNYRTTACNTVDCCSAGFGKFRCSNDKCINKNWICDGDNDCGNNDDESRSRCPSYLRSGDTIALKSNARGSSWVSCYCTVNCGVKECKLSRCPGSTMDPGDWSKCDSETFYIILTYHNESGRAIRNGDGVAFYYGAEHWLSCWGSGNRCRTTICPGAFTYDFNKNCCGEMFWIYTPDRVSNKPIHKGDTVFIKYSYTRGYSWWLSQDDGVIKTRTCPGDSITRDDKSRCSSESWNIIVR